jgi:uncharacterized protein (TIGR04255 family)
MYESAEKAHFEPVHKAHAIEQVVFVVQGGKPLPDKELLEACRLTKDKFKGDLPGEADLQSLEVVFGPAVGSRRMQKTGKVFNRARPDGTIENELRVERESITYITSAYSRWNAIWEQAQRYFNLLMPAYLALGPPTALSLKYVDKFVWKGDPEQCVPGLLLREGSDYISPNLFRERDLWHSHTGAFRRSSNQVKRLVAVNADCVDEPVEDDVRRVVVISTVFTDMFNQPKYDSFEIAPNAGPKFISEHMNLLHDESKVVFANVVNDEISKRIGLRL